MKKLFLVIIILSLTGCWNYRELNELALTTGIALDKTEDGYLMTILISNSKKSSSSGSESQAATVVYEGKGKTIFEAGKDVALAVSKQVYISHIETLIVSEEISKTDIIDALDFLFRYPQVRNEFYVVVAQECKASDVLKITMPLESFPSQNISKNLELTNKLQAFTSAITFNELVFDLLAEGLNPTLPTIHIIGDVESGNKNENIEQNMPDTYLKLGMLAIFKGDKLIDIAKSDESKGINIVNNRVKTTIIPATFDNNEAIVELNSLDVKYSFILNDIPEVTLDIKVDGAIQEVTGNLDLRDENVLKIIKSKAEEKVNDYANKAIIYAQEKKTDIFGIGNKIYKKNYKYWYKVKENWDDEIFPNIKFNINTTFTIETKGNISDIVKEEHGNN